MLSKVLNGLVQSVVDRWLASDEARRYVTSAIFRGGQLLMLTLLERWASKYGIEAGAQAVITGHWQAILELAAPAVGAAVLEFASWARAKVQAKALEVAVRAPALSMTPAMAQEVAKEIVHA